ncbi:MAG: D-glycero-beta-D-manno-heptose-7-phosphate kinase [Candidatus Manganitrophaceae bacterium]|nr:MAG: D-glycero-beta-D-manno-heptose-7-phosphate kinase [Candidatus Manganitrophaceae bacterium]
MPSSQRKKKPSSNDRAASKKELRPYVDRLEGHRVLVVGDLMLDHYIWGSVQRISPEAPVPVVNVLRESVLLGGAGNVLHNILTLGGRGLLCSVVGADDAGRWLSEDLKAKGVEIGGIVVEDERPTTKKTRIIAHQQQIVRYDHEKKSQISSKTEKKFIQFINEQIYHIDCMVISDYAKGVITKGLLRTILPLALRRGIPVVVDPKVHHFSLYKKVTVVTPNHLEASQASGIEIVDEATLRQAGKVLLKKLGCRAVLITRGEQGMSLFDKSGEITHIPTEARQVFDVTGAGDTVVSTLSLAISAGAPLPAAARLANHAAGVVVGMVGTTAIEKAMLERALS